MSGVDVAARRRGYVAIALRRARPGAGSGEAVLQARSSSYRGMDLRQVITRTAFVVVGGVATRLYMPERATLDIDILVRTRDAADLAGELRAAGAERAGDLTVGGSTRSTWRLPDGTPLDVIESSQEWVEAALSAPQRGPDGLPYVALPYLVVMKLQAGRAQDIADVSRMLGQTDERTLEDVRDAVRAYVPDGAQDLEGLIVLGRLEVRGETE